MKELKEKTIKGTDKTLKSVGYQRLSPKDKLHENDTYFDGGGIDTPMLIRDLSGEIVCVSPDEQEALRRWLNMKHNADMTAKKKEIREK